MGQLAEVEEDVVDRLNAAVALLVAIALADDVIVAAIRRCLSNAS